MSMEIIFPKISMIWFGNLLEVWSAMLIGALIAMAVGYKVGSRLVQRNQDSKWLLVACYVVAAGVFLLMPRFNGLFESFLTLNTGVGSLLVALILLLPSIGILAITSPIIVAAFERDATNDRLKSSYIFGASTIAGVLVILMAGLYFLPYLGIAWMCAAMGGILLLNALLAATLPKEL